MPNAPSPLPETDDEPVERGGTRGAASHLGKADAGNTHAGKSPAPFLLRQPRGENDDGVLAEAPGSTPAPAREAERPVAAPAPRANRLPGLEILRCVAAACVLLLHTRAVFGGKPVFAQGYLGVDFFLMLSGFLMGRVQEPRFVSGPGTSWRFLARRYARLWPMMAIGIAIGLPMEWVRSHGGWTFFGNGLANLALLPAPWAFFAFPLDIPAWTIFAEMVANALHVFALRWLSGRWLAGLLAVLGAGTVGIALWHHSLDVGAKPGTLSLGLLRCLFAYTLGLGLARWWQTHRVPPVPSLLAIPAMPALLAAGYYMRWHGWWFDSGFVLLVCPLMLAGGLRLRHGARIAAWLGRLAFPLFAWQIPILEALRHLHYSYWQGMSAALAGGVLGIFVERWLPKGKKV